MGHVNLVGNDQFLPKEGYELYAGGRNVDQERSHISARRAGVKRRYAEIVLDRSGALRHLRLAFWL